MSNQLLSTYQKAVNDKLTGQDRDWLLAQSKQYPYSGAIPMLLAKYAIQNTSPSQTAYLQRASAYAYDRKQLEAFLYPSASTYEIDLATILDDTSGKKLPETDKAEPLPQIKSGEKQLPQIEEKKQTESVSHTQPCQPVSPMSWYLNTRINLRINQYKDTADKLLNEIKKYTIPVEKGTATPKTEAITQENPAKSKPEKANSSSPVPQEPDPKTVATSESLKTTPAPQITNSPVSVGPEYEIGAFSSFSFVEGQIQKKSAVRQEKNRVWVEEEGRTVEVKISEADREKYFKKKENKADKTDTNKQEKKEHVQQVIDRFIETEPSVSPINPDLNDQKIKAMAEASAREDEHWVTETLAKIHVKQGNDKKAIQIYERLRLLFPEKKAYFTDQILKLKS